MLKCDRCGKFIDESSSWGNCTLCGDDICEDCAHGFNEHGECRRCNDHGKVVDKEN